MNDPLVSIVLPTHNGSRYLEGAIRSILAQGYQNWELILVDDCSTDSTPQIIAKFAGTDPRIHSIRHEKNKRLPGALNSGFSAAKGELLTWTSDDNEYKPPAIETMVRFLQQNSDVDFVFCDQTRVAADLSFLGVYRVTEPDTLVEGTIPTGCFLYRRLVHERVGPYAEDLFLAEDYDFCLRAFATCRLAALHENHYLYREHEGSLSATKKLQADFAGETALRRAMPRLPLDRRLKARAWYSLARRASHRKAWLPTARALLAAFVRAPLFTLGKVGDLVRRRGG
jgi:glycosyltransferase involved in cell wall biosynthesis